MSMMSLCNHEMGTVDFTNSFFLVPSQQQRHQQPNDSLPVVLPDLPVWLRLPRPAHQVRPQASQEALIPPAGGAFRAIQLNHYIPGAFPQGYGKPEPSYFNINVLG